jgi:histidinol dehydrogenase
MIEVLKLESLNEATRDRLLNRSSSLDETVKERVAQILRAVRERGDAAVCEFTECFDGVRLTALRVLPTQIRQALDLIPRRLLSALKCAKHQIECFQRRQRLRGFRLEALPGVELGQLVKPFERVGIYVPKNLLSSLLMAAVPARLAGVSELVVCTPPQPGGTVPQAVLAAAALLDIDEIYAIGGAQAIGAMSYGTESIRKVEKIVGPGNAYITAAKALVRDAVGIDLLAGPSEIFLIVEHVDGLSEATLIRWALTELRAQLEHGPGTSATVLTSLPNLANGVAQGLSLQETRDRHVAVLLYRDRTAALDFANAYAPEHLCLWGDEAESLLERVENAGSVFLGPWSPVACGDYASGTNHILPTARQARFHSGLSVRDFVKTISYQRVGAQGLQALTPTVTALAEVEGMTAHAVSVQMRLEEVAPCERA